MACYREGTQILNGWVNEWMMLEVHRGWVISWLWCEETQVRATGLDYETFKVPSIKLASFLAMNILYSLPEAPKLRDGGPIPQESLLTLHSWAWIHPPASVHAYSFHFTIDFHFQFGFGDQNPPFSFCKGLWGHCFHSSLLYTLQPRTGFPPHVSLVSV